MFTYAALRRVESVKISGIKTRTKINYYYYRLVLKIFQSQHDDNNNYYYCA